MKMANIYLIKELINNMRKLINDMEWLRFEIPHFGSHYLLKDIEKEAKLLNIDLKQELNQLMEEIDITISELNRLKKIIKGGVSNDSKRSNCM